MCFKISLWVTLSNYLCGIRIDQLICQYGASWLQYLKNWFPITSCEEIAKEYREALWGVPGTGMEQPYTWEWRVDSWELHLTLKSGKWICEVSIDHYRRVLCRFFCLQMSLRMSKVLGQPKAPLDRHHTCSRFWTATVTYINDSSQQISWPGWRLRCFQVRNSQ